MFDPTDASGIPLQPLNPLFNAAVSRYESSGRAGPTPLQSATSAFQGQQSLEIAYGRRYYIKRRPDNTAESFISPSEQNEPPGFPFALKLYRGRESTSIVIEHDWDDERLFSELSRCYNDILSWRKYVSVRTFSSFSIIWTDVTDIAARYGKAPPGRRFAKYKHLPSIRIRNYMRYPDQAKGRIEFTQWFTLDQKHGILFVERWSPYRIVILVLLPIVASLMLVVLRVHLGVISDEALTTANLVIAMYSIALSSIGLLNWFEYI